MMGYQDEEESPCIHHRSLFDTIPAPPSFAARKPSEPTLMSTRDFTGKGDDGEPVRVSANGRAAFPVDENVYFSNGLIAFPGGVTEVRKPTRGELLLSAKQWATAVRECFVDNFQARSGSFAADKQMLSKLDRLDAVLKELAES